MSKAESKKDFSGRVQHVLIHDVETGTKKQIKASDQDAIRRAVPPTHELKQNREPRQSPSQAFLSRSSDTKCWRRHETNNRVTELSGR